MLANHGDQLPVSAFPSTAHGPWAPRSGKSAISPRTFPCGTKRCASSATSARWSARTRPFASKVYAPDLLVAALRRRSRAWPTKARTSPAGTRCRSRRKTARAVCSASRCARRKTSRRPIARALEMAPQAPLREAERRNYEFFLQLPEADRAKVGHDVKSTQLLEPLFEYSGACAGCGETPYIKLVTQLFGDRAIVANATGCSSIFGGNLPTTPYTANREGRGPAWANSLFEDNAEFGLGIRLAVDQHEGRARDLLRMFGGLLPGHARRDAADARSVERGRHSRATAGCRAAEAAAGRAAGGRRAGRTCRLPGEEERLDCRRRRVGVRHRLRRPRSRAGERGERERARARHRGVFQHRRAAVEGDAHRRRREIRIGRQSRREERPGPHGDGVWPCLCCPGGDGRERFPDAEGASSKRRRIPGRRS